MYNQPNHTYMSLCIALPEHSTHGTHVANSLFNEIRVVEH